MAKWLKPSLILVSSFEPSKFWVEEILLGSGLMNFSIRFLNIWHEEELRKLISRLFHSVITAGKKELLKKSVFASVLTFLYFYTIANFYSHSHHYCYDYFCYYCFCHCHCHYYFFIFNAFNLFKVIQTLFKVGIKGTEAVSVSMMGTLNTVCLIYSSDDLLLKWHCYILPLTIISFILYFFNLDLLRCWVICIFVYNFIIH